MAATAASSLRVRALRYRALIGVVGAGASISA
jgi:hypothetical protein